MLQAVLVDVVEFCHGLRRVCVEGGLTLRCRLRRHTFTLALGFFELNKKMNLI